MNPAPPPFKYNDIMTITLQPGESIILPQVPIQLAQTKELTLSFNVHGGGGSGDTVRLPDTDEKPLNITLYPRWIIPGEWADPFLCASTTYNANDAIEPWWG